MNSAQLQAVLTKLLALPAETEWVEFKEAKNDYHFDRLGEYFSALSNEANLKAYLEMFEKVFNGRDLTLVDKYVSPDFKSRYAPPTAPKAESVVVTLPATLRGRLVLLAREKGYFAEQGLEVTWPPTDMPWGVREMHVRHSDWKKAGVPIASAPEQKPWGIYEFISEDCDGNSYRVFYDTETPKQKRG